MHNDPNIHEPQQLYVKQENKQQTTNNNGHNEQSQWKIHINNNEQQTKTTMNNDYNKQWQMDNTQYKWITMYNELQ